MMCEFDVVERDELEGNEDGNAVGGNAFRE